MGVCDPFRFDELPDIETKIYHFAGLVYGDFDGALFAEAARHGKVAVDVQCLLRQWRRTGPWPSTTGRKRSSTCR